MPPPSQANASLVDLQHSETFTNDASSGTVTVPASGPYTSAAAPGAVTVVYDAAARSYTVSTAGRTQTFTAANRDSAQSTATLDVYVRQDGAVIDSLALTRPSTASSGSLNYQYVGGGVWQRDVIGAGGARSATFDSSAYGVETPDGSVPRAGQARYEVDLLGATAWQTQIAALSGRGALTISFASGTITGLGEALETSVVDRAPIGSGDWRVTAQLSANANLFSGTFQLYPTSPWIVSGPLSARFYGPLAQEVGGAFALTGSTAHGQGSVSGLLLGRRVESGFDTGLNSSLADLRFDQRFPLAVGGLGYSVNATGGHDGQTVGRFPMARSLQYRADAGGRWEVIDDAGSPVVSFGAGDRVAAESNNRYTVYQTGSGTTVDRLLLYRPGSGNDQLALTYASFGAFQRVSGADRRVDWFAYGIRTVPSGMPRTGQATYAAVLNGTALTGRAGDAPLSVEGDGRFLFNFQNMLFTGFMDPVGVDPSGTRTSFGRYDFNMGFVRPDDATASFSASFLRNGQEVVQGGLGGFFAGPNGEEIGGTFGTLFVPPGSNAFTGTLIGSFVGRRCTTC